MSGQNPVCGRINPWPYYQDYYQVVTMTLLLWWERTKLSEYWRTKDANAVQVYYLTPFQCSAARVFTTSHGALFTFLFDNMQYFTNPHVEIDNVRLEFLFQSLESCYTTLADGEDRVMSITNMQFTKASKKN